MVEPWHTTTQWTPERVAQLTKLWTDGYSASQVADRLGGTTRNAVIAKVHRLGLEGRRQTTVRRIYKRRARATRSDPISIKRIGAHTDSPLSMPHIAPEPLPDPRDIDVPRVSLMDLEPHHCHAVCGDAKTHYTKSLYCGNPAIPGTLWCRDHLRVYAREIQPAQPTAIPNSWPGTGLKSVAALRDVEEFTKPESVA